MDFKEAIKYVVWVKKADDVAELTLRDYEYHFDLFARFAESRGVTKVEEVNSDLVREYILEAEKAGNKPRTINGKIRYLKAAFNVLEEDGFVRTNPVRGLKLRKEPLDTVQPLPDEMVMRILEQPNKRTFIGRRDYVCMLVMLDTGIRPSELLQLTVDDWQDTHLIVREEIAKDRTRRLLPLSQGVLRELKKYEVVRKGWGGKILFPSQDGGRLKTRSFGDNIKKYAKKAGMDDKKVTPYMFRHTFAVNFLRNGGDVFTLQKLLGHESLEMTRIYLQLSNQDVTMVHEKASVVEKFIKTERKRRRL